MKKTDLQKLWDIVNACETIEEINHAEKIGDSAGLDNENWEELRRALSYQSYEFYRDQKAYRR